MRIFERLPVAAAILSRFAIAQDVNGNESAENSTTPHVREGDHTVHFVTVGKATNNFYPNSIRAEPGDIVMFQFYPTNHSVIKAAYGYPCIPYEDLGLDGGTFFSGFFPVAEITDQPPSWNLTINDTSPIFYYCGAPGSCTGWGMVGGINLNSSTPISNQIGLARKADYMLLPGQPFPNEDQQASLASLAAKATTSTFTITATPSSESSPAASSTSASADDNHDHGLSAGATAGIAVGSAIAALAGAGLLFLLLRTRSLKKRLDAQQDAQNRPPPMGYGPPWGYQHRTMSQLPPYEAGQEYKPPDGEGYAGGDVPSRHMSPNLSGMGSPYNAQGQFVGYPGADPRMNRYTMQSELSGSVGPRVEMEAPPPQQSPGHRYA